MSRRCKWVNARRRMRRCVNVHASAESAENSARVPAIIIPAADHVAEERSPGGSTTGYGGYGDDCIAVQFARAPERERKNSGGTLRPLRDPGCCSPVVLSGVRPRVNQVLSGRTWDMI